MKSILLSVQPWHTMNILNKKKLLEIRTSIPKCELPCKVYIYCTKAKTINKKLVRYKCPITKKYKFTIGYYGDRFDGRIVAEFILKKTNKFDYAGLEFYDMKDLVLEQSCLSNCELKSYIKDKIAYGWHIDDLIVYNHPKNLIDFAILTTKKDKDFEVYNNNKTYYYKFLHRPPQSWCYVEKMEVV